MYWLPFDILIFVVVNSIIHFNNIPAQIKVDNELDKTDNLPSKPNNQTDLMYHDAKLHFSAEFVWSSHISKKMVEQFRSW